MMGEHLIELDPEADILDAFSCFDEGDKGVVDVKEMRKWLGEMGDRMQDWEVSPGLLHMIHNSGSHPVAIPSFHVP